MICGITILCNVINLLKIVMPVRIALYGGAVKGNENSAFEFAHKNVLNDYGIEKGYTKISAVLSNGAQQIREVIAAQQDNDIQSLDLFCHGNQNGLYFKKGAKVSKDIPSSSDDINLYRNWNVLFDDVRDIQTTHLLDQIRIRDLDFDKFTKACKIEIHGCLTANTATVHDNICQMLSELLYDAGKTEAVVIGHTTLSNPNINGTTDLSKQDYRHGQRAIYHAGQLKMLTYTKGRIYLSEIKEAIRTTTLIKKEKK